MAVQFLRCRRRSSFAYCGANLALPESLFIDYSGAVSVRQENHCGLN